MLGRQILFMDAEPSPFGGRCLQPRPQTDEGRVCGDCLFTAGSGKLRRGEGTPPYI